jgi:hypothetical protein
MGQKLTENHCVTDRIFYSYSFFAMFVYGNNELRTERRFGGRLALA